MVQNNLTYHSEFYALSKAWSSVQQENVLDHQIHLFTSIVVFNMYIF